MFEDAIPDLSDEQRMILDSATRFVEESYPYAKRRAAVAAGTTLDRTIWSDIAELGWLGLGIDEAAGGFGGTPADCALICEALGRGQLLEPFTMCGILPSRLLSRLEGARAAELVAALIAGEQVLALAFSEPQARGDLSAVTTMAQPQGETWRIDGLKSLVVGGDVADTILVTARQPDGEIGLFVLDRTETGVSAQGERLFDWTSGVDLIFENAAAPRIGSGAELMQALRYAADEAMLMLCAEAVGAIDGAIAITAAHIAGRKQFGVPLASFQVLQHRIADMTVELVIARSAVVRALGYLNASQEERSAQVSGCKALVSRIGRWATGQGIQLHGGYGLTEEYQVGQYFKRLLVMDAMFGSRDLHLANYTQHMLARIGSAGNPVDIE